MRITIRYLAVAAVLVSAVSSAPTGAFAFTGENGSPPAGPPFNRMAEELGLTAQQQRDIRTIFRKDREQFHPLLNQLVAERRALRELIRADAIDETAIRAQSARVAALQADLAVRRAHMGREVRNMLTPEQALKFGEFQARMDRKRDQAFSRATERIERDN